MIRILQSAVLLLAGTVAVSAAVPLAMPASENSASAAGAESPAPGKEKSSESAASGKESAAATPARFREGDMFAFGRYVRDHLTFSENQYTEGERLQLTVMFRAMKNGRVKEVELPRPSGDPVDKQVLRLVRESTGWTPAKGGNLAHKEMLVLDMLLVSGADGTLRAEDHSAYTKVDTMPAFEGGGPKKFREWVVAQVGDRWPDGSPIDERVKVSFVIEKDGSLSDVSVHGQKETPEWLPERIGKILAAAPLWKPAVKQGETVRFRGALELLFGKKAGRAAADTTDPNDDDALLFAEQMPSFQSGDLLSFRRWVMGHLRYPAEAARRRIEGRVLVAFVIEQDGSLTQIKVLQSPDPLLSQAVIAALRDSPKWKPGMQYGRVVRVKYTLPIDFHIPAS